MKTERQIKCLVWDLDNTIWDGTLAEEDSCHLKTGVTTVLRSLDSRGILLSIASANDEQPAIAQLKKSRVSRYFIHPRINWDNKAKNIRAIAKHLGISLDTIGFIDDEPFERAQVQMLLPDVRTYRADEYRKLIELPEFNPSFLTDESKRRREMYLQTERRATAEKASHMNRTDFLQWTRTALTFGTACDTDLERIMELMNRTSQLNATGKVYRPEQVRYFLSDPKYIVYIAMLKDRFVDYGKIGVAICKRHRDRWRLISFCVSCRVLSRGISNVFLNMVRYEANKHGAKTFEACYRERDRNRKMLMLYKLSGLAYLGEDGNGISLFAGSSRKKPFIPKWLTITGESAHE
ncbi:MAG: HAD-IIIC family phosphatase [Candidatus Zixiibacteriota bacterium]|nr:MAG: HAD-IIIC family phosphatase [candidate division Zixibacteria bacterium]